MSSNVSLLKMGQFLSRQTSFDQCMNYSYIVDENSEKRNELYHQGLSCHDISDIYGHPFLRCHFIAICMHSLIVFYHTIWIGVGTFDLCGQVTTAVRGTFSVVFQQQGAVKGSRGSAVFIGIVASCPYTTVELACKLIPENYIVVTVSSFYFPYGDLKLWICS